MWFYRTLVTAPLLYLYTYFLKNPNARQWRNTSSKYCSDGTRYC